MKKTILSVSAVFCLLSMPALADRITLKSGTVLTGKVLGTEGDVIKFESDDFGKLDVKPGDVVAVADASQKPVKVAEIQPVPKEPEVWHGFIVGSFLAARGNTTENSWGLDANANRRYESDRLNFDLAYHFSETGKADGDKQKTTDRWEIEGKHDHFWMDKVYSYEDLKWERDKIAQLNSRYRIGLGGGYQWLEGYVHEKTGKWDFNQELGLNWIKEEYENNDDQKNDGFAALRYAHHLGFLPKFNDNTEFFHNFEFLPEVDDWDKFLIQANVGFSTKIYKELAFNAKIEWEYNSKPADERKKSDVRYILGLGYKW